MAFPDSRLPTPDCLPSAIDLIPALPVNCGGDASWSQFTERYFHRPASPSSILLPFKGQNLMPLDLEVIWDKITDTASAVGEGLARSLTGLFGSSNERQIRRMLSTVEQIGALGEKMRGLSDEQLKECTVDFRRRLSDGATLDELLVEAFAACREASHRTLGKGRWVDDRFSGRQIPYMAHFDVQLLGGMVLHSGKIAEMVTGEGKTLVATLPAYLNALSGKGVHVVTVNDYLARRDAEWMAPIFQALGLSVGFIQANMEGGERQGAYNCDITYGTNNEFGFDYLRDNMKPARRGDPRYEPWQQQVQGPLHFAIIDEVDNILIDEARTPLIISGPAEDDTTKYYKANQIAKQLKLDAHFEVKEKEHTCHMTEDGNREAERLVGVESFYTPGNMHWPHLIDQALKAHHLYHKDKEYVVMNGEVIIVDEFTGRLMHGRHWSDGLHQAVEAKEGVRIKEENQTLATITLQNFFKLYKKLAGMTGTAMTEASEFLKIYKLDVLAIPPNRPLQRLNFPDVIFRTQREKYHAIVEDVKEVHATGRPILLGTTSIENSELLSGMIRREGIKHEVLNAKYHEREAEIVAQAGRKSAVTIATNMAGRGTDIILGGNPEFLAWAELKDQYAGRLDVPPEVWKQKVDEIESKEKMREEGREVASLGGLHIVGTERHEARRIDNQLRGRAGRQGDPGSGRFFLSLQDDLMRIFAGEWVSNVLTRLGMQEGEAIESRMVSRRIEAAQKKVEERNFDIRKNLLEYDEVMDEQRKRVYSFRQNILNGATCKQIIMDMIGEQIRLALVRLMDPRYGTDTFTEWASRELGAELESNDFRGVEFLQAEQIARDTALDQAESQIAEALDEQLPRDSEESEWNWQALAQWANTRWDLKLKDRELKRIGRDTLDEYLLEAARESISQVSLEQGRLFLSPEWGIRSLCGWAHHKFGIALDPATLVDKSADELTKQLSEQARQIYAQKEIEFPVRVGLARFMAERAGGGQRYDREGLVQWANQRFEAHLDIDEVRSKFRSDMFEILMGLSRGYFDGDRVTAEMQDRLSAAYGPEGNERNGEGPNAAEIDKLSDWCLQKLGCSVPASDLMTLTRTSAKKRLLDAIDDHHRPEMREMERTLVLQILDGSWKDHLYSMDHLRSAIGLRGYAQVDPKVEYKREGMKIFEEMWTGVGDKVTDLVFRMEQVDAGFLGSLWNADRMVTTHADATGSGITAQQDAAIAASKGDQKKEPIRNRTQKVGRNDPCPCGSGKKYKQCCLRTGG
jgi:preprotein translocase subunit SecA